MTSEKYNSNKNNTIKLEFINVFNKCVNNLLDNKIVTHGLTNNEIDYFNKFNEYIKINSIDNINKQYTTKQNNISTYLHISKQNDDTSNNENKSFIINNNINNINNNINNNTIGTNNTSIKFIEYFEKQIIISMSDIPIVLYEQHSILNTNIINIDNNIDNNINNKRWCNYVPHLDDWKKNMIGINDYEKYYEYINKKIDYDKFIDIYDKLILYTNNINIDLNNIRMIFYREYCVDPTIVFLYYRQKFPMISNDEYKNLKYIKLYMQYTFQKNSINLFISKTKEFSTLTKQIYDDNNCYVIVLKYLNVIFEIFNKNNVCIWDNILINYLNYYPTKYDQCYFINNIYSNINNVNMNVYQFIMGSGKSTTIIPYLLYKN